MESHNEDRTKWEHDDRSRDAEISALTSEIKLKDFEMVKAREEHERNLSVLEVRGFSWLYSRELCCAIAVVYGYSLSLLRTTYFKFSVCRSVFHKLG